VEDEPQLSVRGTALTRRDIVVRGSIALTLSSPLLRLAASAERAFAAVSTPCAMGAFVNPENSRQTFHRAHQATAEFEALINRRLDFVSTFVAWEEPFPNGGHALDRDAGRTPLLAWDGRSDLAAIHRGRWDGLLRQRAADCRDYGAPIYIRWAAEFNGEWNPCYGRRRDFVRAWRHIVKTFHASGATNVRWVWCPFATAGVRTAASDWQGYYPGDRFVDWVGMDGYNWGTTRSWSRWQSFEEIFAPLYAAYAGRKPLMICEVASAERGGDKPAWIRDMGAALRGRLSKVKGLVWFECDKETDWRINSSPAALAAFRSVLAQPRFA
jgi:endoglucanase